MPFTPQTLSGSQHPQSVMWYQLIPVELARLKKEKVNHLIGEAESMREIEVKVSPSAAALAYSLPLSVQLSCCDHYSV
jgi:hypothetical protein